MFRDPGQEPPLEALLRRGEGIQVFGGFPVRREPFGKLDRHLIERDRLDLLHVEVPPLADECEYFPEGGLVLLLLRPDRFPPPFPADVVVDPPCIVPPVDAYRQPSFRLRGFFSFGFSGKGVTFSISGLPSSGGGMVHVTHCDLSPCADEGGFRMAGHLPRFQESLGHRH